MMPGVAAAGEVAPAAKVDNYLASIDRSRDMAAMTAQFVATVTMLFNTLAGAFSQLSKMKWVPQQGWAYTGGDWTVAVMGNWGVFVETSKADFNLLYKELGGKD